MPKIRSSDQSLLNQWITFHSKTDQTNFTTHGAVVYFQCDKKISITTHVDTALRGSALKHKLNDNKNKYFYCKI